MLNKCAFIGNLTKDPELRYTAQGTAVANFSIACNEKFKDKDGNTKEETEFVNIVVWKRLAETCGNYLTKGKQIYIEGKMQTRHYDDKDGNRKYVTEIIGNKMVMLGGKEKSKESNQPGPREQQYNNDKQQPTFDDDNSIPF